MTESQFCSTDSIEAALGDPKPSLDILTPDNLHDKSVNLVNDYKRKCGEKVAAGWDVFADCMV